MESVFVINRYFLARFDITQGEEQDVAVDRFHVRVGFAGMIDVVRAVSKAAAVETPTPIDVTDPQNASFPGALSGLKVRNSFAGVLCDLLSPVEYGFRETTFAVDW